MTRPCCQTAPHDADCSCWACFAQVLGAELNLRRTVQAPTTFEIACEKADREILARRQTISNLADAASAKAEREKQAPQVTLEALVIAVRTGGLAALDRPINKTRYAEVSPRQREELRARLKQLQVAT